MYPGNRLNLMAASNMQVSTNSGNTTNFNLDNTTSPGRSRFYMHGRMGAGVFSSAESMHAQAAVGNFLPHPALHVESEVEHMPHCGNGVGGLVENTYGRANQFNDGGRSFKRKSLEGISGYSCNDGPSYCYSQQRNGSSGFTVPMRHDVGTVSIFSTPGVTLASARYREEQVIPRLGLMEGPSMDYRSSALSVTRAIECPQRRVQRRSNTTYHEEQNLSRLSSSHNYDWHAHPRSSLSEQQNVNLAATNANAILHNRCQFPTSLVFESRDWILDERNENMPTVGSRFSFNASGRERPSSLRVETSSSSMIARVSNQGWPVSVADSRISDDDLSIRVPITRNLSGISYTDPICANPIQSLRATDPWDPTQNLHTQIPRANFDVAQGSICNSRSGQGNHLTRSSGAISFTPVDMVINPETGLQGPHHWRSPWMEQRTDWYLRPLTRDILDISFERLQSLQQENDRHNGIISEDFLLFDPLEFYGGVDIHDQHRDMRLDVDNMTYEELLALGERIGNVSTGLTEESISKCLKIRTYFSSSKSSADEASQKCSICQEAYEDDDELGTLECGHDHHTKCINKWLLQKNECPVCKASALNT